MSDKLNLVELKSQAKLLGYSKIRRAVPDGPIVSLESWPGFSTEADSGFSHVAVWYRLDRDRVVVSKLGGADALYFLS
jgi:hypothetical protein